MRLLVSVTDADEANAAVRGGAHLIDVKNPHEGALGAGLPHVVAAIRAVVPAKLPVSAALGDLPFLPGTAALAAVGAALSGADLVKVGLRGARTPAEAEALLTAVAESLRRSAPRTALVACAYADAEAIGAIPADLLPAVAARAGCAGAMIDTFNKVDGALFRHLCFERVERFVRDCRGRGLISALAGSLTGETLLLAASAAPDVVGVRSAACVGGDRRQGRVDPEAVAAIIRLLQIEPVEVH
jgi:(5-formylfuran-3-yl)methyl phosphate synthase